MRFLFVLIFLFPCFSYGVDWGSEECEFQYFSINESGYGEFSVNRGQIYLNIKSESVVGGFDIFYIKPADLGRGGMNFDWKSYSTEIPIAEVREKDGRYIIIWKGFFDTLSGEYLWVDEPDIVRGRSGYEVEIQECE